MLDQVESAECEEWRSVVGYEGWYSVSSLGRVRRDAPGRGTLPGKILRPQPTGDGYRFVGLSCPDTKRRLVLVHQLVCVAFHGPKPTEGHEIGHRDGDRLNNAARNVRWVTPLQNAQDKFAHGTVRQGERHPRAKLTEAEVQEIRARLDVGEQGRAIAALYGVHKTTVSSIRVGKNWRASRPDVVGPMERYG